jgi:Fe2+ or Zn2+ uptake regulation protein
MTKAVDEAVAYLVSTYKNVSEEARKWRLNPDEIASALKKAKPDTAEYNVLLLLADTNIVEMLSTNDASTFAESIIAPIDADSSI